MSEDASSPTPASDPNFWADSDARNQKWRAEQEAAEAERRNRLFPGDNVELNGHSIAVPEAGGGDSFGKANTVGILLNYNGSPRWFTVPYTNSFPP